MKKIILFTVIIISLLVYAGCGNKKSQKDNKKIEIDTIPVTLIDAEVVDFTEVGSYYGEISPYNKATLVSYTGGRVNSISVKEGAWVSKNKSLAKIDGEKASIMLEMAEAGEKLAKETYHRAVKQLAKENISKVEHDKANLDWITAKQRLLDARIAWRGAYCISPINGIVTSRFIELNDEVVPGSPTFNVAQVHKLKINIGIPESEIVGVKEGSFARVQVGLYPDREWTGKITRLSKEVNSNGRVFNAEITINNKDKLLKPGLTAKVVVDRRLIKDKVVVPTELILTESTHNYVMTYEEGFAKYHKVELGPSNETHTVINSGIESGKKIINEGNSLVHDNSPVRVIVK